MVVAKAKREQRRQWGQFITPPIIANRLVDDLSLNVCSRVLEPSFGDGSFVFPLIERLIALHSGTQEERLGKVLTENLFGVEIDPLLYEKCLSGIAERWGPLPSQHNLMQGDFFRAVPSPVGSGPTLGCFDTIVGNPPFGGTFDRLIEDELDGQYGKSLGRKIKKETYAFFLMKSLELLNESGALRFICSDTFLTIKTMRGLREHLMAQGQVSIEDLDHFSDETSYPMVVVDFFKGKSSSDVSVNGKVIPSSLMEITGNTSWGVTAELGRYFSGRSLGDFLVATSGMTTGNNELFLRPIFGDQIVEDKEFYFVDEPITLERELEKARLGKLPLRKRQELMDAEDAGKTERRLAWRELDSPKTVKLPHPDYALYNKSNPRVIYAEPSHAIYWRDDGDAVITYKKTGNWYLRGVGGRKFFGRKGLTWQLVSSRLNVRFLPEGYILDSGAPCAFLRDDVDDDELFFILGWSLTPICTEILKTVINHTRNIQSKDFEKLPYPVWVPADVKAKIITHMRELVAQSLSGHSYDRDHPDVKWLASAFTFRETERLPDEPSHELRLF